MMDKDRGLKKCLKHANEIDDFLESFWKEAAEKYEYEDEDYSIRMFRSLEHIMEESYMQEMPLWHLVQWMVFKEEILLALRKKWDEETSFITIEIVDDNKIIDAKMKNYRDIPEHMKEWLSEYAEKKGLVLRLPESEQLYCGPEYDRGDEVAFMIDGVKKYGIVEMIDVYRTYEPPIEPAYNILVPEEDCIYKYIRESWICERTG